MLLLYIFVLVMIFSSLPLLVTVTKKASEGATMRRAIEQAGGKFIPTHTFWYVGSVEKEKCDFHVLYDGRIISVKVISLMSSRVFLNFVDKSTYEIKTLGKTDSLSNPDVSYSKKKKKPYDFKYKLPSEYEKLPRARVILMNSPLPARITKTRGGERAELKRGDNTGEGELYETHDFIELFR